MEKGGAGGEGQQKRQDFGNTGALGKVCAGITALVCCIVLEVLHDSVLESAGLGDAGHHCLACCYD